MLMKKYLLGLALLGASLSFIGQAVAGCKTSEECAEGETCIITTGNTEGYCAYY